MSHGCGFLGRCHTVKQGFISVLKVPLFRDVNLYQDHLKKLVNAGVRGFKCFLIESGVDVSVPSRSTVIKLILP
jgi:hypothetical protein